MTAKEKVRRLYPDAVIRYTGSIFAFGVTLIVYESSHGKELGRHDTNRESWAWAEAWRRTQASKKEEKH